MPALTGVPATAPLLERERELALLDGAIARAAAGHGAAIVMEGPAGIGKTSLVEAAAGLARAAGLEVLTARGGELERDLAHGVVRELFERRLARAPAAQRAALLDGAAGFAAPLLGLPGDPAGAWQDPAATALHGLYWLTANLAGRAPLLLAVDDLHWADAASLRFAAYLARRVGELPVLLLGATRPPAECHRPDLLEALLAAPEVRRLEPAALTVEAVGELLAEPGADLARAGHEATGGNPLLVRALARALAETPGTGPVDPGRLPEMGARAVMRTVGRRLARLGPGPLELARAVAVLGTDVEPRHAYEIAALGPDEGAAAEDALVAAGVLAARRPLEFVHPVVRAAVAEPLSPPERARRHRAAARMLAAEGREPARIAPHLLAADARADPWVVDVLRRAASDALARGAPDAAVRALRRALDEPPRPGERPAVLAELGGAEVRAGLPAAAVEHLQAALARTADPGERARMAQDLAIGLIAPGRYAEAVAMLEQALGDARGADGELARRLEAELLCAARLDARTLPVARAVHARLPAALPGDTPGARMLLAACAHERLMRGGTAAEVGALAARALDGGIVAEQSGDSGLVMDAGFAAMAAGDFARADAAWDAAVADARRRGSVIGFARCSCLRAMLRVQQGRPAEAEGDARAAVEAGREPGYRVALMAHGPLIDALVDQGELDAAAAALEAVGLDGEMPDSFMLNFALLARGRLRAERGEHAAAAADLTELGRREARWRASNPQVMPYRSLLALLPGTDPGEARRLAAEELALARRWGTAGALGRALRAVGLVTGDEDALREGLEVVRGSPWRLEEARCLLAAGAAARRANRRREAREPLREAMELAHRLGARGVVARAREELLAAGARPRRIVRTGVEALTASELRVARMAAAGMANKAIAQALFVTVRTVEVHLTHAFSKLDVRRREELAAALGRPGTT